MIDECFECGSSDDIEYHHVIPRARGGRSVVPLCFRCHAKVHSRKSVDTSELTKAGIARKRLRGEHTGGPMPYGWQLAGDGVTVIMHAEQQFILAEMAEMRERGMSYQKIADALNRKGIKRHKGKRWDKNAAMRALRRYQDG